MGCEAPVYSVLCDTDLSAYLAYLTTYREKVGCDKKNGCILSEGCGGFVGGGVRAISGSGGDARCGFVDHHGDDNAGAQELGSMGDVSRDTCDDVAGGAGSRACGAGEGSPVGVSDHCNYCHGRGVAGSAGHAARGSVADTVGSLIAEKTKVNRERRSKRKCKKIRRQVAQGKRPAVDLERPASMSPSGFWNSVTEETRDKLIQSKAEMHIADNRKRAAEAMERVRYLESPEALVDRAVKLTEIARKRAVNANDSTVMGWAATVTNSSAESLAKTAPSCVQSFSTYKSDVTEDLIEKEVCRRVEDQRAVDKEANAELVRREVDEAVAKLRLSDGAKVGVPRAITPATPIVKIKRDAALEASGAFTNAWGDVGTTQRVMPRVPMRPGETTQEHFLRVQAVKRQLGISNFSSKVN